MPSDPTSRIGARNRPLIEVAELVRRLGDPHLRVVDVRWVLAEPGAGRRAYEAGHIPGAIFLDLDADLADPEGYGAPGRHPLPSPAVFANRLAAAGVDDADLVVPYDDAGGWVAARLWWMLDDLGFNAPGRAGGVAVLDGGWSAWLAAGLPTSTEVPALAPARGPLRLADRWTRVIDRQAVQARLPELILLDGRAAERYRGETEPIDPVAGHIPTALSAPWSDSVDEAQRVLAPRTLRDRYAALGAGPSPAGQVVSYCGSGVTACHHALAMRVAGLPDPTIYVGSYSDWSRSGLPVATGPGPGDPPTAFPPRAGRAGRDVPEALEVRRPDLSEPVRVAPLTVETWDALAGLFGEGGDPRWCWCQYWRLRSKDFAALKVPELRARLAAQAASPEPPGLVALEPLEAGARLPGAPERAVGWLGLGPIASFERIVRSKVIPRVDDRPVWSIACFAVSPSARGRGVGTALLHAAIEYARGCGAVALEAYPIVVEPGESITAEFAFTGTLPMFERAGFEVVADRASDPSSRYRRVVVRREL